MCTGTLALHESSTCQRLAGSNLRPWSCLAQISHSTVQRLFQVLGQQASICLEHGVQQNSGDQIVMVRDLQEDHMC